MLVRADSTLTTWTIFPSRPLLQQARSGTPVSGTSNVAGVKVTLFDLGLFGGIW
jgi:hypothetical protein